MTFCVIEIMVYACGFSESFDLILTIKLFFEIIFFKTISLTEPLYQIKKMNILFDRYLKQKFFGVSKVIKS